MKARGTMNLDKDHFHHIRKDKVIEAISFKTVAHKLASFFRDLQNTRLFHAFQIAQIASIRLNFHIILKHHETKPDH